MNIGQLTRKYAKYVVLAAIVYFPIFLHLTKLPIRIWDEARLATNAYEMLNNHDLIVTHFNGEPDMWNTKPPLMIWLQVISMKIFGVGELAVRIPSAIAAFLTCIVLLLVSVRYLKSFNYGLIAILVFITSEGYIHPHASRTGDYDALLTLFTTLSGFLFFLHCETKRNLHLYGFFLFTTLAILTKSITGLLFLPALLIYSIISKQLILILRNKHAYAGVALMMFFVLGYYLWREHYNPGFIKAVYDNELGGRYLEVIEGHQQEFWFYVKSMIETRFSIWYLLVPCGVATGFVVEDGRMKRLIIFSSIMTASFLLIISTAQSKLEWYDVPVYPFLALIVASFIFEVFSFLDASGWFRQRFSMNILPYIFLFLLFFQPYKHIVDKVYFPKEFDWDKDFYQISHYLKDAVKGKHDMNNTFLLYEGYNAHVSFYLNILADKGIRTGFKDWKQLSPGDKVISGQTSINEFLSQHYNHTILYTDGNVNVYAIH